MPVWLDAIPEKAPKVPRPVTRRWLLFLALLMLVGIALAFWNWYGERSGFVFWFTALGLPFCSWGLIFSIRRFAYKAGQVAAESRNVEREKLIDSEIRRGHRCAWILGTYIQTSVGNKPGELRAAIARSVPLVDYSQPRKATVPVRYAALTDFQKNLAEELQSTLSKLSGRIQDITEVLPLDITCWLIFDCDSDIEDQVLEQFKNELSHKTGRVFRLMPGKGLAAFDNWLDKRWDHPGILALVTLALPAAPDEDDADAIAMMVLSNRKADDFPAAVRLHRPERGERSTLSKTLSRALLWARIGPQALRGGWFTGKMLTKGSDWNKACEDSGVTFSLTKENTGIDQALGYAGQASPWLAITLAEASFETGGPQVIAAQPAADKEDIWVTVITKEEAPKE